MTHRRLTRTRLTMALASFTTVIGTMTVIAPAAQGALVGPYTDEATGLIFEADDEDGAAGASIVDFDEEVGGSNVTIPATVDIGGHVYDVTRIDEAAFESEGLQSLAFAPSSNVTEIGASAFYDNDLETVKIPSSVVKINEDAFGYNVLTSVTLSDGLNSIGEGAFADNFLTDVTLSDGLKTIAEGAFYDNELTQISIPASVTNVGAFAFDDNRDLLAVWLVGDAPTVVAGEVSGESFDTDSGELVVHYLSTKHGFNFPEWLWNGYETMREFAVSIAGAPQEGVVMGAAPTQSPGGLPLVVPPGITLKYDWYIDGVFSGFSDVLVNPSDPNTIAPGHPFSEFIPPRAAVGRPVSVVATAMSSVSQTVVGQATAGTPVLTKSPYKRLVLSASRVKRGTKFRVVATGLKPNQKFKIQSNGKTRVSGRADSSGMVVRYVSFKANTKAGKRAVKVLGLKSQGFKKKYSASTKVSVYK